MPECYIRGSTIKYLRIPDEIIDMVKEEVQRPRGEGRGRGRGGRGGPGGRGKQLLLQHNYLQALKYQLNTIYRYDLKPFL